MPNRINPDTNIELVKKGYELFWAGEFDAFFELFTDDFKWIVSDGFPYAGQYQGREEVMEGVFRPIQNEWDRFDHALDRLVDGGETIVAIGEYDCTHQTTGREVNASMVHVFDIQDGKIERFQQYTDTALFHAALPPEHRTLWE